MKVVLFCHSLVSDWNHGNAHFLRGIARELVRRGHVVRAFEPADGWSRANLLAEQGTAALDRFAARFPMLESATYRLDRLDVDSALDGADLVLVHEWTDPAVVAAIGKRRAAGGRFRALFHDTHHRALTQRDAIVRLPIQSFDGVLAFGEVIREMYAASGWARAAWTWHEAADVALFRPLPDRAVEGDLVWIGNWGDEERTAELATYLFEPVTALGLRAAVYGVRYPEAAQRQLAERAIDYRGWLPNDRVPETFARHRMTVHVPRRPYVEALPGIPTIRVFEALACGVPLVCAPWRDVERLFGEDDFLVARDGAAMRRHLRDLADDDDLAAALRRNGLRTILARHTCAHRVDELLHICRAIDPPGGAQPEDARELVR